MGKTAADVLIDTIHDWGVDVVFGLPGDGINGIMEALRKRQDEVRFIHVRHEEAAAFMACAYAKFTGKLGVCLATSGPGGIHLLNGLYDAKLDGQPVLAITGLAFHDLIDTAPAAGRRAGQAVHGRGGVQQPHHGREPRPAERWTSPAAPRSSIAASRISRSRRTRRRRSSTSIAPQRAAPHFGRLGHQRRARRTRTTCAGLRRFSTRGARLPSWRAAARWTRATNWRMAEMLGAPIVKALLGKACVPDDSPYTTGGIGLLGTAPSQDALEACDTLLIVGTSFPYIEFYPKPGAGPSRADRHSTRRGLGCAIPVEVGLVGDSRATLQALLPLLSATTTGSFLEKAQDGMGRVAGD